MVGWGMGLPGVLSTRPHRLVFLAAGDACLFGATLKYGDPVENWTPEMQYVYAAFAWMTVWYVTLRLWTTLRHTPTTVTVSRKARGCLWQDPDQAYHGARFQAAGGPEQASRGRGCRNRR